MSGGMALLSQLSPSCTALPLGQADAPCMSSQRSGVMNTYEATVPLARSPASAVNGLWCAAQVLFVAEGGIPETSWKKTNGSCRGTNMSTAAIGHGCPERLAASTYSVHPRPAATICV